MKKYAFSDAEMLDIFNSIDNAQSALGVFTEAIMSTYNAIFNQDGKTLDWVDGPKHNPMDYGIPKDQWDAINNRIYDRMNALGVDALNMTNVMLEWSNYSPEKYNPLEPEHSHLVAKQLADFPYTVHERVND